MTSQDLLHVIYKPQSAFSLKAVINNIIALGLDGEHMCYLIARVRLVCLPRTSYYSLFSHCVQM